MYINDGEAVSTYEEGTIPILLVVSHQGALRETHYESQFLMYRDSEVRVVDLAHHIKDYLDVHVLVNESQFIDPNSLTSRELPFRRQISEIISQHGIYLILDLHGMLDEGLLHAAPHESSSSTGDALGFIVNKYKRRMGMRPDVDLEFRRRARVLSTTCCGPLVGCFKKEILNFGFIVGIEAVFPGGDIIGYHSSPKTQALAIEVARRVRDDNDRLSLLALAITRALTASFDLTPRMPTDSPASKLPSYDEISQAGRLRGLPEQEDMR